MTSKQSLWIAFALVVLAPQAHSQDEKAKVVTTLAYLGDVVRAVGGEHVSVEVLAPVGQDPHFIVPTPARAVVLSHADALIESGIQLELWSERVIDLARNQSIRPGSGGHTYAAVGVRPLQVPRNQSRAGGDVHVGGNPHVWLDPMNLKVVAKNVETTLARVRPGHTQSFARNRKAFEAKLNELYYGKDLVRVLGAKLLSRLQKQGRLIGFLKSKSFKGKPLASVAGGWLKRALDLEGLSVISYHQVWTYFEASFGIKVVGTIETKPGIPPSPGHLDLLERTAKATGARLVISAPFYPFSRSEGLAERIGGNALVLPTQPGEVGTSDIFSMFDGIFDALEKGSKKRSGE
jgi:zinc/manganese transport system substrate-binding protein